MPTATSFTALGGGNGFPSCIPKIDLTSGVSSVTDGSLGAADFWVTLGGVSGGTASQAQIDLSLNNAMKLYWNQYSITAGNLSSSSSGSSTFTLSRSSSVENNNAEAIYQKTISGEKSDYVPVERQCGNPEIQSRNMAFSDFHEDETGDNISPLNFSSVSINGRQSEFKILRMYNGSTDDESNFVGYGVNDLAFAFTRTQLRMVPAEAGSIDASVKVQVSSFFRGQEQSGTDPDSGNEVDEKFFNCTLSGMDFISFTECSARSRVSSASSSTIENVVSASALSGTASSNFNANFGSPVSNSSEGTAECKASIAGLGFYTY